MPLFTKKNGSKARAANKKAALSPQTSSRSHPHIPKHGYMLLETPPSASLSRRTSRKLSPRTRRINEKRDGPSVKPRVYRGGKSPRRAPVRRTKSVRAKTRKGNRSVRRAKSVGHKSRTPSFTVGSRVASFGSRGLPDSPSF
tara:strand:+ start:3238 stop:3663 length:426 start_codon:yes stop_codon:yes gene_type:complete